MKRKLLPKPGSVIDSKILEEARRAVHCDQISRVAKCVVCAGACAPNSAEGLCWVCRRLKISAWRDSDTQAAVQE